MVWLIKIVGAVLIGLVIAVATLPFWVDERRVEQVASGAMNSAADMVMGAANAAVDAASGAVGSAASIGTGVVGEGGGLVWLGSLRAIEPARNGACAVTIPVAAVRLIRLAVEDLDLVPSQTRDGITLPRVELRIEGDEPVHLAVMASGPAFWDITGERGSLVQMAVSEAAAPVPGAVSGIPAGRLVRMDRRCADKVWPSPEAIGPGQEDEARWTIGDEAMTAPDRLFDEAHSLAGAAYVALPGGHGR